MSKLSGQSKLFRAILLWTVFFLTAFSLGYPTLNRYDPTKSPLADTRYYAQMVQEDLSSVPDSHWRYRVLTPLMAKPLFHWAQGRVGSWDPVFFALLVVNAVFCASTALLLVWFGLRLFDDPRAGLLAAFLYLTNFNVSNQYLSGLVDASEVFFLVVLAWSLYHRRWWPLPLIGIAGAVAKETFVPFAGAIFTGWYLVDGWYRGHRIAPAASGTVMVGLGLATVVVVRLLVAGHPQMPWETASNEISSLSRIALNLSSTLFNRNILYTFAVLGPLGLLGLSRIPRGWVAGSILAALVALVLGAGVGAGDNIGRPMFSALGPVLTLAAADILWTWLKPASSGV